MNLQRWRGLLAAHLVPDLMATWNKKLDIQASSIFELVQQIIAHHYHENLQLSYKVAEQEVAIKRLKEQINEVKVTLMNHIESHHEAQEVLHNAFMKLGKFD